MSETLVDNQTCADCGTEIRAAALFCYHCGAAVVEVQKTKKGKSTGSFKTKTNSRKKTSPSLVQNKIGLKTDLGDSSDDSVSELRDEAPVNGNGDGAMPTAASLRNKTRRLERKKIEIFWEEHENAPNGWFIFVSLALAIFTIAIFMVAMYLK